MGGRGAKDCRSVVAFVGFSEERVNLIHGSCGNLFDSSEQGCGPVVRFSLCLCDQCCVSQCDGSVGSVRDRCNYLCIKIDYMTLLSGLNLVLASLGTSNLDGATCTPLSQRSRILAGWRDSSVTTHRQDCRCPRRAGCAGSTGVDCRRLQSINNVVDIPYATEGVDHDAMWQPVGTKTSITIRCGWL